MIKDGKEYPATHSMSTAWYIVDDDGNVGIIDYNENGPVPWSTEQTDINELVWGHFDFKKVEKIRFNLTENQILDNLGKCSLPSECRCWLYIVVQIDTKKEEKFLSLSENKDFNIEVCISKELGYYKVDTSGSTDSLLPNPNSTLQKMIDDEIILRVFDAEKFYCEDDDDDDNPGVNKYFDTASYFIYGQSFATGLIHRLCIPQNPIKIRQVPDVFRHRIHHIPGNFNDIESFQIAEFHPCSAMRNKTIAYDNCDYYLGNNSSSQKSYFIKEIYIVSPDPHSDRVVFNSKTITPTILLFYGNDKHDYSELYYKSDIIIYYSLFIKYNKPLEFVINELKPYVIILRDDIVEEFTSSYNIDNHIININNEQIPVYKFSELETFREEITALAKMPYRGKKYRLEISEEEMNQLIKEGKAKYND